MAIWNGRKQPKVRYMSGYGLMIALSRRTKGMGSFCSAIPLPT